jgi:hypothetical protein
VSLGEVGTAPYWQGARHARNLNRARLAHPRAPFAYADVIEFGSDPTGAQRWYGIVERYEPGQWLTLQGPSPHRPKRTGQPINSSPPSDTPPNHEQLDHHERIGTDADTSETADREQNPDLMRI